ncbi:hypothetical protein HU200_041362 [Digitaria exilis]|uniref:Protein kinase domain-containing protein n=1 Tax=Digitaria exilis TaxID=1010633 RepID=A0A835B4G2_9POAL|nr:hypothetical protein HU200_041362 [Digitaria exilis]
MEFSRLLLLRLPVAVLWVLAAADVVAPAKNSGCPNTSWCGDVEVPYPYALDKECAIHSGFHLNCSTVGGTSMLLYTDAEVTKISVKENKAWLKTPISRQCYNQSTKRMTYNDTWVNTTGTPFVYAISCMSSCDGQIPKNGSCSGVGCCQADVPRGVHYFRGYFNPLYNTTARKWWKTPCSYVGVIENKAFDFNTTYLTSTEFYDTEGSRIPIVMEWAITRNTCEEAKINKNTPYACVSNHSHCITNDAGYACMCSDGYRGNPYIVGGCAGGHGKVYKGVSKSNEEVAVKRCMTIDEQQKKEFGKEMLILSQINHRNIVKLLGCCLEVEVPMLVYEYVPNGTLFHLIHGNHRRHISLDTRVRVAHESAEALTYLHSCASPPIVHGDVKSSNILLNGEFTAKVSDFGASILAPNDESQFVTLIQGTCGYLDPEYMQTCQLTDKSDVYSFGVVLLELLTRRRSFNLKGPEHEKSLSMVFLEAMKENKLEDIIDDGIKKDENLEFLDEIAELAKQCLEMCGADRPSMKEVADKLGSLRKVLQHPWADDKDTEVFDSLLGASSSVNSGVILSTGNSSITKKASMGLESGR